MFSIILIFNLNIFELRVEYFVWVMFAKKSENLVQRDPSAAIKSLFNPGWVGGGGGGGLSNSPLHLLPPLAKPLPKP